MKFELSIDEVKRIEAWALEQHKIVIAKSPDSQFHYGAIGGELTYSFTLTGLGVITVVKHAGTNAELDLTDYDSW